MLSLEAALEAVRTRACVLSPRPASLAESLGCVLAEDIAADLDLPPFDKALVDGYAIRAMDFSGRDCSFRTGEEITAGSVPSRPLGPREAALITTGAPLPVGADSVVMIERSRREGASVRFDVPEIASGANRLSRGREMQAGEVVLSRGTRLNSVKLGLLASVGRTTISIIPRPRVSIVSTGDELVDPGQRPGPGQIRNSNATVLHAMASAAGADVQVLPIAPDEPRALRETLALGLNADILLITGGVSAGHRDLVPASLLELQVERIFHKVRLKPGKPLWFGLGPPLHENKARTLVFGLPGNPVGGIVGFLLFVRPALDICKGLPENLDRSMDTRLARTFIHAGERPTYHPARRRMHPEPEIPTVETLEWAGSSDLRTAALADGFAIFPAGDHSYNPGDLVRFLPLD
ncbi:MAG: molybdopterin molybdotransferase MoeA [Isosphaeraceae bacterium]